MEIIKGRLGCSVYGAREKHKLAVGEVAILDHTGVLICICKDDEELIKLSIDSHREENDV